MSSTARPTRTPAISGGNSHDSVKEDEGGRPAKTFLDNWIEPPMRTPAPSFADYPHLSIERHGVLENMAPLGTLPSSKVKKSAKADAPRRPLTSKKPDSATPTPREITTPEPPVNVSRRSSVSRKPEDGDWNPKTPSGQTSARKVAVRGSLANQLQSAQGSPAQSLSLSKSKDERHLLKIDQIIEHAVEEALQVRRYPTAYALRTLYNDHRTNPRIVRLLELVINSRADEAQLREFEALMRYKKKEGAKDNIAVKYFESHDNVYTPVNIFSTQWSIGAPSKRVSVEAMAGNRASTSPHKEAGHISKKAKGNHHQNNNINSLQLHHKKSSGTMNGLNSTAKSQNGASSVSITRSRSVSSSSSLSSLDEAVLGGGFVAPSAAAEQRETNQAQAQAQAPPAQSRPRSQANAAAEKLARNHNAHPMTQPQHKAPGPKLHTFATTNSNNSTAKASRSSSSNNSAKDINTAASKNVNDIDTMRSYLQETYTPQPLFPALPPTHSKSHKKGAAAALAAATRRAATPREEEIARRKREAKATTDSIKVERSFIRSPRRAAHDRDSDSESAKNVTVASQPVKPLLRFRRRGGNDESDDHSSPTRLSFQPDLAPGSARGSRAGTPVNSRPTRKAKNSGPRMKTSPMKKGAGTSAGLPRASGERHSPVAGAHNQDENDDYCASCGGNGDLLCCDGCTRSFHLRCVDPPVLEGHLPDEWFCNICLTLRNPPKSPPPGVFGRLISIIEKRNTQAFHLPKDIRDYFDGVRTGHDGEYEEGAAPKPRTRAALEEASDYLKLKDSKGNFVICHNCKEGSDNRRPIVSCDYCSLQWHLDCLDPPLANPPSLSRRWRCPCHVDDLLSLLPEQLGPAHKFRRIKGASVIRPAIPRGVKNNGYIEIDFTMSDSENDEALSQPAEYGHVYKLPEEGIKLDFISRIRAKNKAARRNSPRRAEVNAIMTERAAIDRYTLQEQQAAFNLAQLASSENNIPGITETLISALLSEASPEVIALMAQGDGAEIHRMKSNAPVNKQDLQALLAMRAVIDKKILELLKSPPTPIEESANLIADKAAENQVDGEIEQADGESAEKPDEAMLDSEKADSPDASMMSI